MDTITYLPSWLNVSGTEVYNGKWIAELKIPDEG